MTAPAKKSIFDGVKYIYSEMITRPSKLTIKKIVDGIEFVDPRGSKSIGMDIYFEETEKCLGVVGVTVRRQIAAACGTDKTEEMTGKQIILHTIKSSKSASGQAIRVQAVGGAQ